MRKIQLRLLVFYIWWPFPMHLDHFCPVAFKIFKGSWLPVADSTGKVGWLFTILLEVVLKTFLFCVSAPQIGSIRGVCRYAPFRTTSCMRLQGRMQNTLDSCFSVSSSWIHLVGSMKKPMGHHACSYQIGGRGQGCRSSKMYLKAIQS